MSVVEYSNDATGTTGKIIIITIFIITTTIIIIIRIELLLLE